MKERPILFNGEMVRAILEGRKTQTRRLVPEWQIPAETAGPHDEFPGNRWISVAQRHPRYGFGVFGATEDECMANYNADYTNLCPYGNRGDWLWVRENFLQLMHGQVTDGRVKYCASIDPRSTGTPKNDGYWWRKRPSIHMPRWASRITLEITGVRVERLQDISEDDAMAEGFPFEGDQPSPRDNFSGLWESINGPDSWEANPWVWVIEFQGIDT